MSINTNRRNPALDLRISKLKLSTNVILLPLAAFVLYTLFNVAASLAPGLLAVSGFKTMTVYAGVATYIMAGLALAISSINIFTAKNKTA